MAIFLTADSKIIVQGITGSEGSKHGARMIAAGTNVVGGTNPRKAGQTVSRCKIVMVDYRPMPIPDSKPVIHSPSRLIVQLGRDYWSVELGQTLAQKKRMKPENLPEALRPEPKRTSTPPGY